MARLRGPGLSFFTAGLHPTPPIDGQDDGHSRDVEVVESGMALHASWRAKGNRHCCHELNAMGGNRRNRIALIRFIHCVAGLIADSDFAKGIAR